MIHVFVGWDSRETTAYNVCRHSLIRRSNVPVDVFPLMEQPLRLNKLFWREREGWTDKLDGKPTSTEFSFTRWLVPEICRRNGITGWVLYVDCDFLFLDNVNRLFLDINNEDKFAVRVVKHNYAPQTSIKMDGKEQQNYFRKCWSSAVLWNMSHQSNGVVTPELINTKPGAYLHGFQWLRDEEIGEIPETWNWIPSVSPTTRIQFDETPSAVHFSLGTPDMPGYEDVEYAQHWRNELAHFQGPRPERDRIRLPG